MLEEARETRVSAQKLPSLWPKTSTKQDK